MKTKEFEKLLQKEIDPDLTIRTNPNHDDIAGVYYKDVYLGIAVPPNEIKDAHDPSYKDAIGHPYKYRKMAYDMVKGKLPKFKKEMADDPSLFIDEPKKKE